MPKSIGTVSNSVSNVIYLKASFLSSYHPQTMTSSDIFKNRYLKKLSKKLYVLGSDSNTTIVVIFVFTRSNEENFKNMDVLCFLSYQQYMTFTYIQIHFVKNCWVILASNNQYRHIVWDNPISIIFKIYICDQLWHEGRQNKFGLVLTFSHIVEGLKSLVSWKFQRSTYPSFQLPLARALLWNKSHWRLVLGWYGWRDCLWKS